jgi:hypothetical protein
MGCNSSVIYANSEILKRNNAPEKTYPSSKGYFKGSMFFQFFE